MCLDKNFVGWFMIMLEVRGRYIFKYAKIFLWYIQNSYLDYCDIFLTHDSKRVRNDHNAGWKHAAQVKAHFLGVNQDKMSRTIAEIVKEYALKKEMIPVPAPVIAPKTSFVSKKT